MLKCTDIKAILIVGVDPIIIGQACEFDYSGTQICKALREEGFKVVLINNNPTTIMTDPNTADVTYVEPITRGAVERVTAKERPDTILPAVGGQTALSCALDLHRHSVLKKYNVELISASPKTIDKAEDRQKFKDAMTRIDLGSAKSDIAHSMDGAMTVQSQIAKEAGTSGYPIVIHPSFTLGGTDDGIAHNREGFEGICKRDLDLSPTNELLIEESLPGWKEYGMEVVRDRANNCIIVCSIENLGPIGIHTGNSITMAPAQMLTDKEYQTLCNVSLAALHEIGVDTGGSNVQFSISPKDGRMIVIEMNPRVSRSSTLTSKATSFPIAKVAAKLVAGYTLDELKSEITGGATPASFEPSIDYIVTKMPRFALEKFPQADSHLATQMKSVGEVMAMGRAFQESFQETLRSLEADVDGLDEKSTDRDEIIEEIGRAGPDRIWYLDDAFRLGLSIDEVYAETSVDPWLLAQIGDIVETEALVKSRTLGNLSVVELRLLKQKGFSGRRLAKLTKTTAKAVRRRRIAEKIRPVYKRIDTCAAEFVTNTAYLYSTHEAEHSGCEAEPTDNKKIMVLGGDPDRIGQGIKFDYCYVHAALAPREGGYETIMINCNPKIVSTNYDTSDRLYFEPVTPEDMLEVVDREKSVGVIVQYSGQTPLRLTLNLEASGVPIVGMSPGMIDAAEDRERFQKLLHSLGLRQPLSRTARAEGEALRLTEEIDYPLVVRPSYVLGGCAMEVVHEPHNSERYVCETVRMSNDSPVLLDRFLNNAIECDVDYLSDGRRVFINGAMEHIEQAGVHSGDSAYSLPPYSLSQTTVDELRRQTAAMAKALDMVGLMNVQFAIQQRDGRNIVYVLEVNPRASRTVPYVSKATGMPLAKVAARCMAGQLLGSQGVETEVVPVYYSVKEAVFPFNKFPGVDPAPGPEMRSTGEVMGIGKTFGETLFRNRLAAGSRLSEKGTVLMTVKDSDKPQAVEVARALHTLGYPIMVTRDAASIIEAASIPIHVVNKMKDDRPHIVDMIKNSEIVLVFTTIDETRAAIADSRSIRQAALAQRVTYYTIIVGARTTVKGLKHMQHLDVYDLQGLHATL